MRRSIHTYILGGDGIWINNWTWSNYIQLSQWYRHLPLLVLCFSTSALWGSSRTAIDAGMCVRLTNQDAFCKFSRHDLHTMYEEKKKKKKLIKTLDIPKGQLHASGSIKDDDTRARAGVNTYVVPKVQIEKMVLEPVTAGRCRSLTTLNVTLPRKGTTDVRSWNRECYSGPQVAMLRKLERGNNWRRERDMVSIDSLIQVFPRCHLSLQKFKQISMVHMLLFFQFFCVS